MPAHFSQFAGTVRLRAGSFVLVMNHHVERDQESLRFALDSEAAYVGVLGLTLAVSDVARGPRGPGLRPVGVEPVESAQPGWPLSRRGDTRGSGGLDSG